MEDREDVTTGLRGESDSGIETEESSNVLLFYFIIKYLLVVILS